MLILLLVYSVGLIALGAWVGRTVRQTDQFFVGGRNLSAGLLFATFLAANIGAGSTVNATGLAYHHGLAAWWWNGSAGIGTLILAFWIGPRIWRVAATHGYLTVGDFLEGRFGRDVRLVAAVIIWIGSLSVYSAQIIGASAVLERVGGVSPVAGSTIAVVAMTAYFVGGGLLSAAWVNRVQLLVIVTGFAFVVPMLVTRAGGLAPVLTSVPDTTFLGGASPGVLGAGWPTIFLLAPAFFLSPGLVQRAYAARDERHLRRGIAWSGLALMVFAFGPVFVGMTARVLMPELVSEPSKLVLPAVLMQAVPWYVGSVALAAVFSAEISSADAVLFMLSTSGARDIYRGYINPDASDADVLRVARIVAVGAGALGFVLAFYHETLLSALSTFYSILSVTLLAPILGGLFLPKAGRVAALTSMAVGLVTLFGGQALLDAPGTAAWLTTHPGVVWVTAPFLGLVTSTLAYLITYWVVGSRTRQSRS